MGLDVLEGFDRQATLSELKGLLSALDPNIFDWYRNDQQTYGQKVTRLREEYELWELIRQINTHDNEPDKTTLRSPGKEGLDKLMEEMTGENVEVAKVASEVQTAVSEVLVPEDSDGFVQATSDTVNNVSGKSPIVTSLAPSSPPKISAIAVLPALRAKIANSQDLQIWRENLYRAMTPPHNPSAVSGLLTRYRYDVLKIYEILRGSKDRTRKSRCSTLQAIICYQKGYSENSQITAQDVRDELESLIQDFSGQRTAGQILEEIQKRTGGTLSVEDMGELRTSPAGQTRPQIEKRLIAGSENGNGKATSIEPEGPVIEKKPKTYQHPAPSRGVKDQQPGRRQWVIPRHIRDELQNNGSSLRPKELLPVPVSLSAPADNGPQFKDLEEALVFLRRQERWVGIFTQIQSCKDDLAVLALLKEGQSALRSILLGVKVSGFIKGANPLKEIARLVLQAESVPVISAPVTSDSTVSMASTPSAAVPVIPSAPVVSAVVTPAAASVSLPVKAVPAAPTPAPKIVPSVPTITKVSPVAPPAVSIPTAISLVVIDPAPKTPYDRLANTIKKDARMMRVILDICGPHIEQKYNLFLPAWETFEKQKAKQGSAAQQTYQKLQQLMRIGKNGWTDIRDYMFDFFDWDFEEVERDLYKEYPWHKRIAKLTGLEAIYINLLAEEMNRLKFVNDLKQIKTNIPVKSESPESWYGYEEAEAGEVSLYSFLANLITIRKHQNADYSTLGIHDFKDILKEMAGGIENRDGE